MKTKNSRNKTENKCTAVLLNQWGFFNFRGSFQNSDFSKDVPDQLSEMSG